MRDDFCAFILTHGRADRVTTYSTLRKQGYTGKIYIVIDDEDSQADAYRERYGNEVLQFCKSEIAKTFDEGDNFNDRRAIIYARNACWMLAEKVGVKYFIQLDDDYLSFAYLFDDRAFSVYQPVVDMNSCLNVMVSFLSETSFHSVAMAQGGDLIGGRSSTTVKSINIKRKAMNSFVCDVSKPFQFVGRINEDVNTYTCEQRKGVTFATIHGVSLTQKQTQTNAGGMTDLYLDSGTYIKSFYSVMYCPSAVLIGSLSNGFNKENARLHHMVNWNACAPKIIREAHKKV